MTLSKHTSMLGRGVKRKWSCLEELEAEVAPAAVTEEKQQQQQQQRAEEDGGGEEEEGGLPAAPPRSETSHLQQRQLVLGLCLEKLQHYRAGVELSLRRSVLLVNTLRQIQEDMRSDGPGVHPDPRLLRGDLREDMPVTCPGCAEGDGGDLPLSPPPSPPEADGSHGPQKSLPAAATAISAFSDAVSAMGYLGDFALDDIFEDIDTSMYETSDFSLWPVSVSLWADEDVKLRPAGHGSSAGSLQSCLMDLNELDHIMEILVKS